MADLRPVVERWIREWWDTEGQRKIANLIRGGRLSGPSISGTIPVASLPASVVQTTGATMTGELIAPDFKASGLTGATAASRYVGATASGAPASGTFAVGDFVIDQSGKLWVCTAAGSPGTWTNAGAAGSGTVTSVGLTVPGEFNVSGSPVTTSGTLAVSKANQSANQVFAGPTSGGAAAPTFRALVAADYPAMVGDSGSGGTKGAVPAPGAGDAAAGKFLNAGGAWSTPSASAGGALSVIADHVTGAGGEASYTFSSIPGTFTHLLLLGMVRSDAAGVNQTDIWLRFNGDTAGNYSSVEVGANNVAQVGGSYVATGATKMQMGLMTAATAPAGSFAPLRLEAPNYASTTPQKAFLGMSGFRRSTTTGDEFVFQGAGFWLNTAAITSITVLPASGNLVQNSRLTLYGLS